MDVGLGSCTTVPTPTSHPVRAGIPGREPALGSGNCLQGEGGESGRDCLYPGKAGCRVMGQAVYRGDARRVLDTEVHLHVGGGMAGGYESMYGGWGYTKLLKYMFSMHPFLLL